MGAGFAKSIKMSHFSAKTAKKTPFYCFFPRFKSRHLNHKKSKRYFVAYFFLYSKVIRDLRGGKAKIFRRRSEESTDDKTTDTRCFPCASAQGASPVTSTTKKSKRYLVAYFFCIPTIFLLYFILSVKSASLLTVYRENPQTFVCEPSLMNLHCLI